VTPAESSAAGSTSVTLPVVHMKVPNPAASIPGADAMVAQTRWVAQAVLSYLPPTERLLYYGGVGALAIAGILEWPVAVVAGAGVWVAGRAQRGTAQVASR
jgi:hypothetical protein